MFHKYRYASKEEIKELLLHYYDGKTGFITLLSRICVKRQIKMCCFTKHYPQIPPSTFKNRVHSVRKGFGNGKRVLIFLFFIFYFLILKTGESTPFKRRKVKNFIEKVKRTRYFWKKCSSF
jgi:hypothetical protein